MKLKRQARLVDDGDTLAFTPHAAVSNTGDFHALNRQIPSPPRVRESFPANQR